MGYEAPTYHRDQMAIRNWRNIYPDADMILVKKDEYGSSTVL